MSKPRVDHIYIADGLAEDCEELMLKCSQVSKLSYEKFCDIWREMDFSCIFHGRQSSAELAEFSEEALHVAKYFMVSNIDNYEKSVAGLFLVYAILNLQPYSKFAALRLVQEDVPAIKNLELVARQERRIDILYILGEVLVKGPCQYHVSARERGLDFCLRKYFDGYIQQVGQKPKGVFHRHNEEINLLKEINSAEERYHKAKANLSVTQDPSLQYVNCNQAVELQYSLKEIASGVIENVNTPIYVAPKEKNTTEPETVSEHHVNVQSIKMKALKNTVAPMRHLTGVQHRTSEPSISTKNKTPPKKGTKKPNSRRKSDSPDKMMSPTRYPWSIKPLFSESDDEIIKIPDEIPSSSQDMTSIEIEPFDDEIYDQNNAETTKESNTNNKKSKRSPRKNASPRKIRKLDLDQSKNDAKNSLKRKIEDSSQNIEASFERIPQEICVNKNVEFEIIDQLTSEPSTSKRKVINKEKIDPFNNQSDQTGKSSTINKVTSKKKVINHEKSNPFNNKIHQIVEPSTSKVKVTRKKKVINHEKSNPFNNKIHQIVEPSTSKVKVTSVKKVINKDKKDQFNNQSDQTEPSTSKVTNEEKVSISEKEKVPRKKMKISNTVGNTRIKRLGIAQYEDTEVDSD